MRLLFVSHSFPPPDAPLANLGGMQRVAVELAGALAADPRIELHPLVLRSPWRGIVRRAVPFLASLAWRVPREVRARRIDAVLFSSITTALPAALMAGGVRRGGALAASIAHGLDVTSPNLAYQLAVRRTLGALDRVLPISRATAEACRTRGVTDGRLQVVPNGIDLARFAGAPNHVLRERPPAGSFLLVSVGRQVPRKGFAWFVAEVMPRLGPRFHYWLAGDGPERGAIQTAARRAGVGDRVRLLGVVGEPELVALYRLGQLFVMPNVPVAGDLEGFGLVMLEAAACGLPALAADLEGIRDVVSEGKNGWLVPSRDATAFAARIEALAADPEGLGALACSAAEHVRDHFTWPAVVDQLVAVLAPGASAPPPARGEGAP
jgi:phosphatidylinositol alpha-1,6-mannosyltransferase